MYPRSLAILYQLSEKDTERDRLGICHGQRSTNGIGTPVKTQKCTHGTVVRVLSSASVYSVNTVSTSEFLRDLHWRSMQPVKP